METSEKILNILKRSEIEVAGERDDRFEVFCPFAEWLHAGKVDNHPSAVVFLNPPHNFYCSACGLSHTLFTTISLLGGYRKNKELQKIADSLICEKVQNSWLDDFKESIKEKEIIKKAVRKIPADLDGIEKYPTAIDYLTSRCVSLDTCIRVGCRFDTYRERICLCNNSDPLVGRAINPESAPKYFNYCNTGTLLGGSNNVKYSDRSVFLVEGMFDLLSLASWSEEVNASVVCSFGCNFSEAQADLLAGFNKIVYIWFDNDDAGNRGALQCSNLLQKRRVLFKRIVIPNKTDAGSLPHDFAKKIFKKQEKIKQFSFI